MKFFTHFITYLLVVISFVKSRPKCTSQCVFSQISTNTRQNSFKPVNVDNLFVPKNGQEVTPSSALVSKNTQKRPISLPAFISPTDFKKEDVLKGSFQPIDTPLFVPKRGPSRPNVVPTPAFVRPSQNNAKDSNTKTVDQLFVQKDVAVEGEKSPSKPDVGFPYFPLFVPKEVATKDNSDNEEVTEIIGDGDDDDFGEVAAPILPLAFAEEEVLAPVLPLAFEDDDQDDLGDVFAPVLPTAFVESDDEALAVQPLAPILPLAFAGDQDAMTSPKQPRVLAMPVQGSENELQEVSAPILPQAFEDETLMNVNAPILPAAFDANDNGVRDEVDEDSSEDDLGNVQAPILPTAFQNDENVAIAAPVLPQAFSPNTQTTETTPTLRRQPSDIDQTILNKRPRIDQSRPDTRFGKFRPSPNTHKKSGSNSKTRYNAASTFQNPITRSRTFTTTRNFRRKSALNPVKEFKHCLFKRLFSLNPFPKD